MAKKKKPDTKKEIQVSKESPRIFDKDEALEYAESIINTVREPLIAMDQYLRVVSVSRSFYDFFKVNPEETVGQLIYDLGNKQWDIPKLRELLETILPQRASFDNYAVEHDFATIGRRIMLLNARQIQRGSEKERIILLAIEDITERKDAEDGLERTRKELEVIKKSADEALEYAESIINTVREPLIIMDQDLRVVTASRSFYGFFKVNSEETVGQLIYDLGNKQWDIPKLRELLETILPQKASFDNYEVEHDFTTIGRRIMLLNARQIERASGKERIILLAIEDITERKRIEAELAYHHEHLEKLVTDRTEELACLNTVLARQNKELEQVVYVASHDLRSPLVNVQGFSKELGYAIEELSKILKSEGMPPDIREKAERILEGEVPDSLKYIVRSISRMDMLLSGLLKLSRMGRAALNFEKLNMNSNISEIVNTFEFQFKEAGATIEVGDLPPCHGDNMQIGQVFANLIGNALKYLDPARPGKIIITGEQRDGQVVYRVEDNGIGIAPEHQDIVFEIFHRLNPDTGEGDGLGLTIVRTILDRHNGKIQLESEPGKGSRVFVSLPCAKKT